MGFYEMMSLFRRVFSISGPNSSCGGLGSQLFYISVHGMARVGAD